MKTIIIIDDDMLISKTLEMKINDIFPDYKIDTAFNFNQALELLKNNSYYLIILDGNLDNNHHGRDLLKIMTEEQKKRVVICSNDDDFVKEAKANNILFISKSGSLNDYRNIFSKIILDI